MEMQKVGKDVDDPAIYRLVVLACTDYDAFIDGYIDLGMLYGWFREVSRRLQVAASSFSKLLCRVLMQSNRSGERTVV